MGVCLLMVGKLRTTAKRAAIRLRSVAGRSTAQGSPVEVTPPLQVRRDPVPELMPPPAGLVHVVLVDGVPVDYGGRTASILAKCRTLYDLGGVESVLLVRNFAPSLPRAIEAMANRGHLCPGLRVVGVSEAYPDESEPGPVDPQFVWSDERRAAEGWYEVPARSRAEGARQFVRYDDGVLQAKLHAVNDRPTVQEQFNQAGTRVRRDDFGPDGRRLAMTLWDGSSDTPCTRVLFRRNGAPLYAHRTQPPVRPGGWPQESGTTTFDTLGRPVAEHATFAPVLHEALDAVIGGRPAILSVEARRLDREVATYRRASVRECYVLHNTHLEPPGDDLGAFRRGFRGLFNRAGDVPAVVFLTDTQRAEAEAELGVHDNFAVIPHAAPETERDPSIQRDPHLVLIMGRLAPQKRLDHAIQAFAQVVRGEPAARLEIFGEGPRRAQLVTLVQRLGIQDSVTFRGYTTDPGREYQRASLCLLSSTFEGAPMVIVEALRHGCPVVSYDIRYGPADIIEEGVNGFLVPDGDIDALADRVARILGDPELARRLQAGCDRAQERFGQRAFGARWFQLFRSLVADMAEPRTQEVDR